MPASLPSSSGIPWKTWHFPFLALPDLQEKLRGDRESFHLHWFMREKSSDSTWCDKETLAEYQRVFRAPDGLRAGLAFYREVARSADQNGRLAGASRLAMPVLALCVDQGPFQIWEARWPPFAPT